MTKLKQALAQSDVSLNDLSYLTRIPVCQLSMIASGKLYPYPRWRTRIAEVIGIPEADLFPAPQQEAAP